MDHVLFLHSKFSGYFLSSLLFSLNKNENLTIHIVVTPNTNDAPFVFNELHSRLKIYNRLETDENKIIELINELSPPSVILQGWDDKVYINAIKKFRGRIPFTLLMDNIWYGQFRQYLGMVYSRLFFVNLFDYIWVPGKPQHNFARKLGFRKKQILHNSYCADLPKFERFYSTFKASKENSFPHKFLFVGRYVREKGLKNLWDAFEKLQHEFPNDWQLVCVGTGPMYENKVESEKIIHKGFIQPDQLSQIISETGVFVLPSLEEHWGVVLHEFAASGYPIISARQVGAASAFLVDKSNGYMYNAENTEELKNALLKIVKTPDNKLIDMGLKSIELSKKINNNLWYESFEKTFVKLH